MIVENKEQDPDIVTKNIVECLQYIKLQCSDVDMSEINIIIGDAIKRIHFLSTCTEGERVKFAERIRSGDCGITNNQELRSKELELDATTLQAFYFFMSFTRASSGARKAFLQFVGENEVGKKDKVLN